MGRITARRPNVHPKANNVAVGCPSYDALRVAVRRPRHRAWTALNGARRTAPSRSRQFLPQREKHPAATALVMAFFGFDEHR
jgi:hypothetical protein